MKIIDIITKYILTILTFSFFGVVFILWGFGSFSSFNKYRYEPKNHLELYRILTGIKEVKYYLSTTKEQRDIERACVINSPRNTMRIEDKAEICHCSLSYFFNLKDKINTGDFKDYVENHIKEFREIETQCIKETLGIE